MARRKTGRDISGVLLLDKPKGYTSNKILQKIKDIFFAKKAGHTGSLDPLATGLLPICFGQATKFSSYLLNADKKYIVTCKLGVSTDSGDADGNIIATRPLKKLSKRLIKSKMREFLGQGQQIPPMHSAIKIQGEALYKKAHRGETIEREPREIVIYSFELLHQTDDELTLEVHCSKGTYIRTLIADLGEKLELGAHVSQLRRTMVGKFNEQEMVSMDKIEQCYSLKDDFVSLNQLLIPTHEMVRQFPKLNVSNDQRFYLRQGQAIRINGAPTSGMASLFFDDSFFGIAKVLEDGRMKPERLIS